MASEPTDRHARPLRKLRISVTDRCNLRCRYCMPEEEYVWLPRHDILDFEEVERLVTVFASLGVDRVRLTGGEPLLRKDLPELVSRIHRRPGIRDLALTTNGILLPRQGADLRAAGLSRVTVSLDSLEPKRFAWLAGRDELKAVRRGIEHAAGLGFASVKINTVVIRGENDGEIPALLEYGRSVGAEVRFIEYMDVGGATHWRREHVVSKTEILAAVERAFGPVVAASQGAGETGSAPAQRYRLQDGTTFGVIASTTQPFCGSCDRSRLTADGHFYLCLYARDGIDLRELLRSGVSDDELEQTIAVAWRGRDDRGAEDRLAVNDRSALADKRELDTNPHLEMHTRGG